MTNPYHIETSPLICPAFLYDEDVRHKTVNNSAIFLNIMNHCNKMLRVLCLAIKKIKNMKQNFLEKSGNFFMNQE